MWFYASLVTSIFSALCVIVSKRLLKNVSALVLTWATLLLATPIILIFALKDGLPVLNYLFLLGVLGSVFFYTIAKVLGFRAMRMAQLSAVYPLVSLGPVFTLSVALLPPLKEIPTQLSIIGIIITLFGCYLLNVGSLKEGLLEPFRVLWKNKAAFLMIIATIVDSVVIIFDKIAINNTIPKNTTFVLMVENLIVIVGLLPILYFRNKNFLQQITLNAKLVLLLGILNAISTIFAFWATGAANVAFVATILKSQILFVLIFSFLFFKDRPKLESVLGTIIMVIGVILIKIGS